MNQWSTLIHAVQVAATEFSFVTGPQGPEGPAGPHIYAT